MCQTGIKAGGLKYSFDDQTNIEPTVLKASASQVMHKQDQTMAIVN